MFPNPPSPLIFPLNKLFAEFTIPSICPNGLLCDKNPFTPSILNDYAIDFAIAPLFC